MIPYSTGPEGHSGGLSADRDKLVGLEKNSILVFQTSLLSCPIWTI